AISRYQGLLKDLPPDHKGAYFVRNRLKQLQWQQQFETGEWIDIQPDKDLTGWCSDIAEHHVDDAGALIASYDPASMRSLLLWQPQFLEGDFEIEGKVEYPTNRAVIGFVVESK